MATRLEGHSSFEFCEATFTYLKQLSLYDKEKPYEILFDVPANVTESRRTNLEFEPSDYRHKVRSVRGREDEFHLDIQGFAFRSSVLSFTDWTNCDAVRNEYIPKMEQELRKVVGENARIFTYDWRLRNSASIFPEVLNLLDPTQALHPAKQPHVDCSWNGSVALLNYHLPDEASQLLKGRVRIINIWRPIRIVENWPLALCDYRSVQQKDLRAADRVRRKFVGETLWSVNAPDSKWYYWPDQTPDEITLFKISDSKEGAGAKHCVHASFDVGKKPCKSRQSIEMRVFVFTDS